jgi:asparagine synthase (glutamine-hydrolysing)
MMHFEPEMQAELCTPQFIDAVGERTPFDLLDETHRLSDASEALDEMLDLDVNRYLPEARSPMLDHMFMEFAASLPSTMKVRNGITKHILKKAAEPLLPAATIYRAKRGFSPPLAPWFKAEFGDYAREVLFDGRLARRGYFRMEVVARMLDEHRRGTDTWQKELWNLLMLELWHRTFIDARPPQARAAVRPALAALAEGNR